MINFIIKFFTGKELVLYDSHRQTLPLILNPYNKKYFIFIEVAIFWHWIPFKSINKWKHRIMYVLLNFLNPKYIITINWISIRESLYKVWTANHPDSKFIVVQHGSYVGGIVTDIPHRYTKCDVFLTWGDYFTEQFKNYNKKKKVSIISFGNPIYNLYSRNALNYTNRSNGKILLLPTALRGRGLYEFYELIKKLKSINFQLVLKEHSKQGNEKLSDGSIKYPSITGIEKTEEKLIEILQVNDFDFIISDHSSALLDAIFFKNKVLYFDPFISNDGHKTIYSTFLSNLFPILSNLNVKEDLLALIDIDRQEKLFFAMVTIGSNRFSFEFK